MEETIRRFFRTLKHQNKAGYIALVTSLVLAGAGAIISIFVYSICNPDFGLFSDVFASFIGFAALFLAARAVTWALHHTEDKNKVSYRNRDMWNQYGTNYRHVFELNNSAFIVYCDKLLQMKKRYKLKVVDEPQSFFKLDPFIKEQCFTLLEAHTMSKTVDSVTVRLGNFEQPTRENGNTAIFHTMRSSYLAHLLTNRALDYLLDGDMSIRRIFESGDVLYPLHRSKLSNHLGINALVFLKGERGEKSWLLLPQRKPDATVAKDGLTASVATRLEMKQNRFQKGYDDEMTEDYIRKGCIEDNLAKSIWVPEEWLNPWLKANKRTKKIEFLGLSRDIYEGGKPTLFYVVYLDMTPDEYMEGRKLWDEEKQKEKQKHREEKSRHREPVPTHSIDEVQTIHIVDWSSVRMEAIYDPKTKQQILPEAKHYDNRLDKAKLQFTEWKGTCKPLPFEQNLISNFWFLGNCKELKLLEK